ncbi:MAG: YicC family protein [Candidatus Omnitrophica bacterium]|nr:YicC family protein [Candidatus Omnitrophota bacterium]
MIKGMTGFGSAEISSGATKGIVEVKSVNHRYLDVGYFLPPGFMLLEDKIRKLVQKDIFRGRISIVMKITKKEAPTVSFNKKVIQTYLKQEKNLKKEFGLSGDLSLGELIRLPGVVDVQETDVNASTLWPAVEKAITKALASLVKMRKREGLSIAKDVKSQLSLMSLQIKKIQLREKQVLFLNKKKMDSEEFESYQKSIDVNEEISRLAHHVVEFQLFLKSNGAVGKKLDFIAQEMQRETNTIGSKIQDKIVSNSVISLKSKIEKLREQAQNVE